MPWIELKLQLCKAIVLSLHKSNRLIVDTVDEFNTYKQNTLKHKHNLLRNDKQNKSLPKSHRFYYFL